MNNIFFSQKLLFGNNGAVEKLLAIAKYKTDTGTNVDILL